MADEILEGQSQIIEKAESHEGLIVPTQRERGQPRIVTSSRLIDDVRRRELRDIPTRLCVFESMCNDADVYTALEANQRMVRRALAGGQFVGTGSSSSREYAEFLNYCIRNMTVGTWFEAVRNMTTATKYGWSDLNIVTERRTYGPYSGRRVLRKLGPRDQNSVYGWLWNEDFTEWRGFVQRPSYRQRRPVTSGNRFDNGISLLNATRFIEQGYPVIRDTQLLHTAYNSTNNNPQGDSPLIHCYDDWFEKRLIVNYEVAGISKDMSGVLVLRVPAELIEKANDPDNYPDEAKEYQELQRNAADLHQGKSSYIVLTSDHDASSRIFDFDMELKGIDGGGKQYQTSEVIEVKRKAIYNCFGAGFILLGQDGSGSYALSSSQTSFHGQHLQYDIEQYVDVINNQLAPRLLAVNNVFANFNDMPVFVPSDPDELPLDEVGKFIQRTKSVGGLTPDVLEEVLRRGKLPVDMIDQIDFTDPATSRAGDGMTTAGPGTAETQGGGDRSTSNSENGGTVERAMHKQFVAEAGTDRIIDAETGQCVNEDELDKSGNYK